MKPKIQFAVALAALCGIAGPGVVLCQAAETESSAQLAAAMSSYEKQQAAEAKARAKDSQWKPACDEVGKIQVGNIKKPGALRNFCLNAEGNLLACYAPESKKPESGIRVYSPKGELLKTLPLEIEPSAICVAKDGSIFVGGSGKLLKLDAAGKILATVDSPVAKVPTKLSAEIEKMLKESLGDSNEGLEKQKERMLQSLENRRSDVTGVAVTDQDVFMAVPTPNAFTYQVYRFDHKLQNPKLVVEQLRGCCGQMDIQTFAGNLWIPHNARHRIESLDRDGKELKKFGKAGKVKASDFGGCCEPKNLRFLPNGDILAAESGPPTCIKRFSADGKFIEVVAVTKEDGDCVRVTVERSADGKQYYMLDTKHDAIRIFAAKS